MANTSKRGKKGKGRAKSQAPSLIKQHTPIQVPKALSLPARPSKQAPSQFPLPSASSNKFPSSPLAINALRVRKKLTQRSIRRSTTDDANATASVPSPATTDKTAPSSQAGSEVDEHMQESPLDTYDPFSPFVQLLNAMRENHRRHELEFRDLTRNLNEARAEVDRLRSNSHEDKLRRTEDELTAMRVELGGLKEHLALFVHTVNATHKFL